MVKWGETLRKGRGHVAFMLIAVMLAAVMLGGIPTIKSHGAERHTVKVGFFPMEGYHERKEDGSPSGMDVEYLENLCDYLDWDIEYVDCESWDNALQKLRDKEIDLVGSAQYSPERAEIYRYADLASGYTFGAIAVDGRSQVAYEDFDAMADITYGIVRTYVRKEEFYEYLAGHGIHKPKVKEYKDAAALREALEKGEVDAMTHSLMEVKEGQRVIGRFAPMPIYYISWQGNDDVMRELNRGIADIKMNRPGLENELMVKYYDSRLDQTVLLTSEEKEYITEKKELKVGYLDGHYPFSYENEEGYRGLSKQVLEEVSVSTGVTFQYIRMENMEEAKKALADGRIDILSYCGETSQSMKKDGLAITRDFARVPHVLIMKKDRRAEAINTLAAVKYGEAEGNLGDFDGEDTQILFLDSQEECLKAVKSGEADAAVCDGYMSEYLLGAEFRFSNMEIHGVLSDMHIIYMAVKDDPDSPLLNILNKEIIEVTDKMVSDYMLQDNFYSKMSLQNFVRENSLVIILVICAAAAYIIFSMHQKLRDSKRIEKLMYHDPEFKIWNLNYLKYRASLKLAEKKKERYAIVCTNIRQFRSYTTLYGWNAGQKLLQAVIDVIGVELDSEKELYARNYGDHFILFVQYEDLDSLKKKLKKLEDRISEEIFHKVQIRMTLTMGVRCLDDMETDVKYAIPDGIQAMHMLKDDSNSIQLYDEGLRRQLKEQHDREKMLDQADVGQCFVAWYQAKVDIRDNRIVGAEALVRFKDPSDNGAIRTPWFFVPYLERTGKIAEIDFAVMEAVCKMIRRHLDMGKEVVPVSCNFSRTHFVKEGFPARFLEMLEKYRVPKELIEMEIGTYIAQGYRYCKPVPEETFEEMLDLGFVTVSDQ